jgi:hypothetical protein
VAAAAPLSAVADGAPWALRLAERRSGSRARGLLELRPDGSAVRQRPVAELLRAGRPELLRAAGPPEPHSGARRAVHRQPEAEPEAARLALPRAQDARCLPAAGPARQPGAADDPDLHQERSATHAAARERVQGYGPALLPDARARVPVRLLEAGSARAAAALAPGPSGRPEPSVPRAVAAEAVLQDAQPEAAVGAAEPSAVRALAQLVAEAQRDAAPRQVAEVRRDAALRRGAAEAQQDVARPPEEVAHPWRAAAWAPLLEPASACRRDRVLPFAPVPRRAARSRHAMRRSRIAWPSGQSWQAAGVEV